MSAIDLVVLGLLCQAPRSAYGIQQEIEKRHLSRWIRMGSFTVYKKVALFEQKGYVTGQLEKAGKTREKVVYTITPAGREAFRELMKELSGAETRIFLELNAVVVNLPLLDKETAAQCVRSIGRSIRNTEQQLAEQAASDGGLSMFGRAVLEQQQRLLKTLSDWEGQFEKELSKTWTEDQC